MLSASAVIALTLITWGVGLGHAYAATTVGWHIEEILVYVLVLIH